MVFFSDSVLWVLTRTSLFLLECLPRCEWRIGTISNNRCNGFWVTWCAYVLHLPAIYTSSHGRPVADRRLEYPSMCVGVPVRRCTCASVYLCVGVPVRRCTCASVYLCVGVPVRRCTFLTQLSRIAYYFLVAWSFFNGDNSQLYNILFLSSCSAALCRGYHSVHLYGTMGGISVGCCHGNFGGKPISGVIKDYWIHF